eukprot:CAMPEP_0197906540 /NCGR_PEP_ID=MMETSP1439-20131203/62897_1 /TAXON_ID=66791 /ORGANISM="Gonyaulax spinifera, Strain CCMP409" /LENGTH=105 /DNA_ID=CAMNT_0043527903 /DNA_START=155 /DNA_END=469 /DNA_ORIENTATION=-
MGPESPRICAPVRPRCTSPSRSSPPVDWWCTRSRIAPPQEGDADGEVLVGAVLTAAAGADAGAAAHEVAVGGALEGLRVGGVAKPAKPETGSGYRQEGKGCDRGG